MTDTGIIRARRLYDGRGKVPLEDRAVVLRGGRIEAVLPAAEAPPSLPVLADAEVAAPGFFDLQINGAGGVLFNDRPDEAGLKQMAEGVRKGGTAWFLPTFITDHDAHYALAIDAVQEALGEVPGVLGVHLEGPFLSSRRPGIHLAGAIRKPTPEDLQRLTKSPVPTLLTLAPDEVPPETIRALSAAGLRVFAGHTEADFETMEAARAAGLRGVTHLFNAMSQVTGRAPGVVGAALTAPDLFAGIIADGVHVHPANLRLALSALGPERLCLVTDAMSPLGTDMRRFELLGKEIRRENGRLTGADGTLAGADISMIEAVRRMIDFTGCSRAEAFQMASLTPARAMGLDCEIGTIEQGKRAGLTLLDARLEPQGVWVDGQLFG